MRPFIILMIAASFFGCAHTIATIRHGDFGATFSVQGKIIDSESLIPIEEVQVYFSGEGLHLKSAITRKISPTHIGESDRDGNIDVEYEYYWSNEEKELSDGSWERIDRLEDTIDITVSKKGYLEAKYQLKLSELPYVENRRIVNLGSVFLKHTHK